MLCGDTAVAPNAAVNVSPACGAIRSAELEMYSVTLIVIGPFGAATPEEATTPDTVIVPAQVPTGNPAGFTETTAEPSVTPVTAALAPSRSSQLEPPHEVSASVAV